MFEVCESNVKSMDQQNIINTIWAYFMPIYNIFVYRKCGIHKNAYAIVLPYAFLSTGKKWIGPNMFQTFS